MKKLITSTLLFVLCASVVQADTAFAANTPPYDPPVEAYITLKWGNISGTPHETGRKSFDGSLSVSRGDVSLEETLYFETHDDGKDQITNKENPVAWTSWIFNHWDGLRAKVVAHPEADITIRTDAGSITVPYATLLTAPRSTSLRFGDGREVIIQVNKIVSDPFYLYTIWGGPIYTPEDETAAVVEIENFAVALQAAESETSFAAAFEGRPELTDKRKNFSGSLSFEGGAHGKLVEPILFETGQGDVITEESENYIAWNSNIYNQFDGLFLKSQLDQYSPIDDTVEIVFTELDHQSSFSLAYLYVHGVEIKRVSADGLTYIVAMIAVKQPYCERNIHPATSIICEQDPALESPIPVLDTLETSHNGSVDAIEMKQKTTPEFSLKHMRKNRT